MSATIQFAVTLFLMLVWSRMELFATDEINRSLSSARVSRINECLAVYCLDWRRKVPLACEVAPANVPPLALSDEIARVGLGPPQVLPSTQPLSKKLNGKKLPEQERRAGWPGWSVFITLRGNDQVLRSPQIL